MTLDTRPKRATIADAEWRVSVELVRNGAVLERSTAPLPISDSFLNNHFDEAGRCVVGWINDTAQRRARRESAQKKARKK